MSVQPLSCGICIDEINDLSHSVHRSITIDYNDQLNMRIQYAITAFLTALLVLVKTPTIENDNHAAALLSLAMANLSLSALVVKYARAFPDNADADRLGAVTSCALTAINCPSSFLRQIVTLTDVALTAIIVDQILCPSCKTAVAKYKITSGGFPNAKDIQVIFGFLFFAAVVRRVSI
jgi:hypothetical protein